ncbi:MAG: response regulator [Candidatus Pacebacteria bacterium]|nr:response regulator [Candidatus Paceibacterota bacterium]
MDTKKILIADDSAFMRKVLIDILTENGFSVFVECANGNEALEKFASEKPDLCLLDIIMPEKDGLEVIKEIGRQANIIVISAVGQDSMISEAKQNGAKGYLIKPFEKEQVVAEVKKILG